jgi:hypothetical protein
MGGSGGDYSKTSSSTSAKKVDFFIRKAPVIIALFVGHSGKY